MEEKDSWEELTEKFDNLKFINEELDEFDRALDLEQRLQSSQKVLEIAKARFTKLKQSKKHNVDDETLLVAFIEIEKRGVATIIDRYKNSSKISNQILHTKGKQYFDYLVNTPPRFKSEKVTKSSYTNTFQWEPSQQTSLENEVTGFRNFLIGLNGIQYILEDYPLEEFIAAFSGKPISKKITWILDTHLLIYTIKEIARARFKLPKGFDLFIENEEWSRSDETKFYGWLFPKIVDCFTSKNGTDYNERQLQQAKYQFKVKHNGYPSGHKNIDEFITKL
jgi:hypothetical protein